jgi:hypothetical protein
MLWRIFADTHRRGSASAARWTPYKLQARIPQACAQLLPARRPQRRSRHVLRGHAPSLPNAAASRRPLPSSYIFRPTPRPASSGRATGGAGTGTSGPRPSDESASPISHQGQPFAQMAIKAVAVPRAYALLRWACTRRALPRHWPRSRMTMLYPRQRRPEFCHPELSCGLRRGFPTVAERMKIHLTTIRNVAD